MIPHKTQPDDKLSASLEDYLEVIFHLVEKDGVARAKDIAKRMNVNMSSVTGALKNLTANGMLRYEPYHYVTLSPEGKKTAGKIVSKHNVLALFLTKVLAVSPEEAESNACKMEHVIDKKVFDSLVKFIGVFEKCPHARQEWLAKFEEQKK